MHPQLQAVIDEFDQALARLDHLAHTVPAGAWATRPDPARWSVGECVAHLNLTSSWYVPVLRQGIADGRALGRQHIGRYRRDVVGWLLWKTMGPPARMRTKTAAAFVPQGDTPATTLIDEFRRLQAEQIACVRDADGLPLGQVTVVSPFNARVKYNLYSCVTILPRHQHRHLWQAEQVWNAMRTRSA